MTTKPWNILTFPTDRPIYIRPKSNYNGGGSLIVMVGLQGVAVWDTATVDTRMRTRLLSWTEIHASCVQLDGSACGIKA